MNVEKLKRVMLAGFSALVLTACRESKGDCRQMGTAGS